MSKILKVTLLALYLYANEYMIQAVRNQALERREYGTGMQCLDEGCILKRYMREGKLALLPLNNAPS
jgi:hypothetical protein